MSQKLTTFRGDTYSLVLNFTDGDGEVIDITNWKIFFTIKENHDDTDDDAVLKKTVSAHSDPTNGTSIVSLADTDTDDLLGRYYYDVQYRRPTGVIKTFVKGYISFKEDVTRRVS